MIDATPAGTPTYVLSEGPVWDPDTARLTWVDIEAGAVLSAPVTAEGVETTEQQRFNPFWSRFSVARHAEIGITRMQVETQGHAVSIGGFLNPDDRESFAAAFSQALATAKAR